MIPTWHSTVYMASLHSTHTYEYTGTSIITQQHDEFYVQEKYFHLLNFPVLFIATFSGDSLYGTCIHTIHRFIIFCRILRWIVPNSIDGKSMEARRVGFQPLSLLAKSLTLNTHTLNMYKHKMSEHAVAVINELKINETIFNRLWNSFINHMVCAFFHVNTISLTVYCI